VTAAAFAAGTTIAGAAPTAPVITSPVSNAPFTTTTISVSGNVQANTDQTVTVWVGANTVGCTVVVPYIESTFTCDVTVPGPGVYTLTASSVDIFDPAPSPRSGPVTVRVGTTAPALMSFPESGSEWPTLTPVISGTGPALGSITVEILFSEGSTTYCTVPEVPASGSWSCSPPAASGWSWTEQAEFRAYGTDLTGGPSFDAIIGDIRPGPPQTEVTLGPASVGFTATGSINVDLFTEVFDVVVLNSEGSDFDLVEVCSPDPDANPPVVSCSQTGLAPGFWHFSTHQLAAEVFSASVLEYVRIPAAPTDFSADVLADRSVQFTGGGVPGYRAGVRASGGSDVCTVIVPPNGSWQCTVALPPGTASYQAIQQSVGFDTNDFGIGSDRSIDGFSALTPAVSVNVPAPPVPPVTPPSPPVTPPVPPVTPPTTTVTSTPLPWVLEGYDGSPLVPGQELSLSAVGLPVGTVVVIEIRSTPRVLGTSVVDGTGTFALDVVVPADLEVGEHTLVATATPPGGVESVVAIPVTVIEPLGPIDSAPGTEEAAPISDGDDGAQTPGGDGDRTQAATPSAISDSIPTIDRIFRTPLVIVLSAGLALAILLLVAFPAELLNSTLASNTRRMGRWYAAVENGIDRATEWFTSVTRTRAIAAAVLVVLTSLIFGFVDPEYGFDPVSLRMTISLAIGLFIVTYVSSWISGAIIRRVWAIDTRVSLQPAALLFAVIGVIVARVLEFSPGFLIGLVIGLDIVSRVGAQYRVRAILTNIGVIVGLAVTAWLGFSLMSALMTGEPTMISLLVSDALIATTAEGLTAALAALLPLGFLDGHEVFRRSKLLWAGTFAAVATVFSLIVLPTAAGETSDVADVGFWMLIMVIFAAVTLTLWAILHFTGRDEGDDDDELVEQPAEAAR
jgi:hypothetical protein